MKKIIVTGATSGIGLETAKQIAQKGHHVILACRNLEKGKVVRDTLLKTSPNSEVSLFQVDLADLASIKSFCLEINKVYDSIDVLINNAGVFSDTIKWTKNGYELTLGTNFLGQVFLTDLLLPLLINTGQARIVNICSEAALYGRLKVSDKLFKKAGKGFLAYSKSKFAQLLFTLDLAETLKTTNIIAFAVHPGQVASNIWKGESLLMKIVGPINMKKYLKPEIAAHIVVKAAFSDQYAYSNGKFIKESGEIIYNKRCLDPVLRKELMAFTRHELNRYLP